MVDPGAAVWPVIWLLGFGLLLTLYGVLWILVTAATEQTGTLSGHTADPVLNHGTSEEVSDHGGEAGIEAAQD